MELSFKWKRRCSFSVMMLYTFMSGVEYGKMTFRAFWSQFDNFGANFTFAFFKANYSTRSK